MKEKFLDKQVLRYVIATTVSGKPTYLKQKLQKIEYSFVSDIDDATKCSSYAIAEAVRKYYEHDTRDTNAGLIIIPVVISYELVKEIANMNKHKILFTGVFNPFLKLLNKQTYVNKVFGNLTIEKELSKYKVDYCKYSLKESIKITEGFR